MKIEKILCPLELERETGILISSSLFLANKFNAHLYFLNAIEKIETPILKVLGYEEKIEKLLEEEKKKREGMLKEITDKIKSEGINAYGIIRYGKAFSEILQFADEIKPDLIIMGVHESYGIEKFFIGSNTWRVIEGKKFPVLTIRKKIEKEFKKIIVPLDLSKISFNAIPYARFFKKKFNSNIYFLHILVILESMAKWESAKKMEEEIKKKMEEEIEKDEEIIVEKAPDAVSGILKIQKDLEADFIIMTTHGRGGIEKALFGSVTERIIRESEIPVLSIPPTF